MCTSMEHVLRVEVQVRRMRHPISPDRILRARLRPSADLLIGVLFLRDPAQGLLTITLLLIIFFMIEGISKVVFALTIRPFPNWGWVLASGLVGILLALILWANLPITALWLIGVLLRSEEHTSELQSRQYL